MMDALLDMTLAGSAVLVLWLACRRFFRLPARWHYRVLKTALFFLLFPVGRLVSAAVRLFPAAPPALSSGVSVTAPVQTPILTAPPAAAMPAPAVTAVSPVTVSEELLRLMMLVWALGAGVMLLRRLYLYLRLRRGLLSYNRGVSSPEALRVFRLCKAETGVRLPVSLRENPLVRTPLAAGLLWPTVVIPVGPLTETELRCLFLHELRHIKSGDLWVRMGAMLAACLHWFNPLALKLRKWVQEYSEQSCDEAVVCAMTRRQRQDYGGVILRFAVDVQAGTADYTAPLAMRENIEGRLIRVLHAEKLKGRKRLLAFALTAAILACGTAAALTMRSPVTATPEDRDKSDGGKTVQTIPDRTGAKPDASPAPAGTVAPEVTPVTLPEETPEATPAEGMEEIPEESVQDRIRAAWNVTSSTAVLYGDRELIVSRGGTILPDDNPENYCGVNNTLYKMFLSKDGCRREEYLVGNEKALEDLGFSLKPLENLIDGDYPRNSLGETYGHEGAAEYVGYSPELSSAIGTNGEHGYLFWEDELPYLSHPVDTYMLPLYDEEHHVIGEFSVGEANPIDVSGMTIDEAKEAIGNDWKPEDEDTPKEYFWDVDDGYVTDEGLRQITLSDGTKLQVSSHVIVKEEVPGSVHVKDYEYPPNPFETGTWTEDMAIHGDTDLVLQRGGTLLPDGEQGSYEYLSTDGYPAGWYKCYLDKDGYPRLEYDLGNPDTVNAYSKPALDLLENGVYPTNANGETYGDIGLADYVGYFPDLRAYYEGHTTDSWKLIGYIRDSEAETVSKEFQEKHQAGSVMMPVYASDGVTVVSEYPFGIGVSHPVNVP